MATLAVELSDVGIRIKRSDQSAVRGPSPGYALVDGKRLVTGNDASEAARLHPTRIHHRFWCELDDAPLSGSRAGGLSHADMAHAHLDQLWRECGTGVDAALLAIPGYLSPDQLALLLGVARACGMPVTGLVDLAVAAAAGRVDGGAALHVDLHLHRVVVSALDGGTTIVRRSVEVGDRTGLVPLQRTWMKQIAQAFVRQTRFDPLHSATTEQSLFDRLPGWLGRLDTERLSAFRMQGGGKEHAAELDREQLVQAVQPDYDEIVELVRRTSPAAGDVRLLLSPSTAGLPGLRARLLEALDGTGVTVFETLTLPVGAVVEGALEHSDAIHSPGEELPLRIALGPADAAGAVSETLPGEALAPGFLLARPAITVARGETTDGLPAGAASDPTVPTHLLVDGEAHPIDERPIRVGTSPPTPGRSIRLVGATAGISRLHCSILRDGDRVVVEDHSRHGSFLGELRVNERAELAVGDRLRVGSPGIELLLVRVLEQDGPA